MRIVHSNIETKEANDQPSIAFQQADLRVKKKAVAKFRELYPGRIENIQKYYPGWDPLEELCK